MTAATPIKAAPRAQAGKAPNLSRIPPAAQQQAPSPLRGELLSTADTLHGAGEVLQQLHGLFEAIRKLGGQDVQPLARIGANLAMEWADTLDAHAERAIAQCNAVDNGSSLTPATPATPTTKAAAPVATLSMAAYDTATLHLERAETLAEILGVLGCKGINELTTSGVTGAFDGLLGELVEIRAALVQGLQGADA
ncbi:hypothetical protein E5198_11965 [Pseudomonas sp. A-1]|uniref:hypothetical protein n=1 Tax=Pseudomonas sp. A-1 TaxID=1821274 RepID=UPI0010A5EF5C|nr:hypothetical protein [Pseudomonas sp. A-1]THG81555.1 hypothetical protein E5198_11965 [Pseudomonas sp. A-1]